MDTRFSPLDHLAATASAAVKTALSHPSHLVKLGIKGPALQQWAQNHDITLPLHLYDTLPVGTDGILARVGNDELILECAPDDALLSHIETSLSETTAEVYRLDQQALTILLGGSAALPVLAQTCGIDFASEPAARMIYTRLAGTSCAVLPHNTTGQRLYRLWIDYSLAVYLWETLTEIITELEV